MENQKKLFLLDAMALIYRAYYAFSRNPRINSKGTNTSAAFGFTNSLLEVLAKEKPSHIAVAFDTYAPTQRHQEFPEYKSHREETPEDIVSSLFVIKEIIRGFNIPVIELDGYEADDIIGTLAKQAEKKGFKVYMMTPDKDFGQLVSDNVFMYKPARLGNEIEIWGIKEVCKKFGIEKPEQVKDMLGLWGDSSDNIPGVPGIGEKKARDLIAQFHSIENLLENVEDVKENRSRESLKKYADQALLSKKLASIILDVPVDFDEEIFKVKSPDKSLLIPVFEELEFRTLSKRLFGVEEVIVKKEDEPTGFSGQMDMFSDSQAFSNPYEVAVGKLQQLLKEKSYHIVDTNEKINSLITTLDSSNSFCFDTETISLDSIDTELVGIAFCINQGEAWYLPIPENRKQAVDIVNQFKPVFENPNIEKTGQNLKFDISVLKSYGVNVKGKLFDTMLAHYLLQPDMRHNMDLLAETYLDYSTVSIEDLIGKKGGNQKSMRSIPIDIAAAYSCEDADITLQLRKHFEPLLKEQNLTQLLEEVEAPLVYVLSELEHQGVKVDEKALNDYSAVLDKEIKEIELEIFQLANKTFNISSPKQLGEILFDELKIVAKPKKTKTKQYSTGEEILIKLVDKHPIVEKILDYRSLTKLKSTYVDALPKLVSEKTGRLHTSYNQAIVATGRLSSNNPNLQNIPIRTERGREIRKAFVPREKDFVLLAADYSQIELRIIASLCKDPSMIDAFNKGYDIHTATAARVWEVDINDVTKEMRRRAKTVNFGIVYGISAFGLSERINIPRAEAAEIINQYFIKYPGVKDYMNTTIEFARKNGYVQTMMGRRRYVPDINSANATVRGYAERNAINAPIQGTAADMIKVAMIKIHRELENQNLKSKMIMQVHDELVFDAHISELEKLKPMVEKCMKDALKLEVPIVVDMNTGNNWLEAH
ncbi:MAG: DNA polymerase I [Bacteroidetes bacterium]|nr:DNA polymerase I [Bacteroidota bacterium]